MRAHNLDNHQDQPPLSARKKTSKVMKNVKPDYGFQYDFINPVSHTSETTAHESQAPKADDDDKTQDQEEEQEYQFRLFTSSAPQQSAPAQAQPSRPTTNPTIRLSATPPPEALAESLSLDKANFIRPNRPDESYYFTSAVPERLLNDLKSQYSQVALSTSDVLSRATSTPWPGTALPWRCIHVIELVNPRSRHKLNRDPSNNTPSASVRAATNLEDINTSSSNADANAGRQHDRQRTRPSKKSRILLRRRLALRAERAAQAEKSAELERQKRTHRNREKKVKRKEREKRKKLEDAADPGTHSQSRQEVEQEDIPMLDVDSKHVSISQNNEKDTSTSAPPAPAPDPGPVSGLGFGDHRKRDETDPGPVTSGTSTPTPKPKPKAPTAPRTTTTETFASSKSKSSTPTTKRPAPTARAV
jgi:hypothetical protein